MVARQASVDNLKNLLKTNPDLKTALTTAIQEAAEDGIETLDQFYDLLNGMLTHIPSDKNLDPSKEKFWLILNESPD